LGSSVPVSLEAFMASPVSNKPSAGRRGPQTERRLTRRSPRPVFFCLSLAAVTIAVYGRVIGFEFINYDDPDYVVDNAPVQAGLTWGGLGWAVGTHHAGNWHPLTWVSHMLDVEAFGTGACGPHAVNLFLHAANAVLLFLLLNRLTGACWRSAFVAGLFSLHPLHVESVAWVSERKDVLSAFFFMLTLWAYARYVDKSIVSPLPPAAGSNQSAGQEPSSTLRRSIAHSPSSTFYLLSLCCYALGLMSKPMLVTAPFVMLLLDYWPLARGQGVAHAEGAVTSPASRFAVHVSRFITPSLLIEKLPFFALSAASCVITFLVQREAGAVQSLTRLSAHARLENSVVSYARYLAKAFWPVALAVPYPHPVSWPPAQVLFTATLVGALSVAAVWLARQRPYLFVGWFWFMGMLVPVIGLVQVGFQSLADRYTYLPLVGVFIVLAWGAGDLATRWPGIRTLAGAGAALLLGACALRTLDQLGYWRNSATLANHAIAVTKDNAAAYANLGNYYLKLGQHDEAIASFRQVTGMLPADAATALANPGPPGDRAREQCRQAFRTKLGLASALPDVLNNLGNALARKGQTDEAMEHYRAALQLRPGYAEALNNLAYEFAARNDYAQAIELYTAAIRSKPDAPRIRSGLGDALVHAGRVDDAIIQFSEAARRAPKDADIRNRLGLALANSGRPAEAIPHFKAALEADPKLVEVHSSLGTALLSAGRPDEAIVQLQLLVEVQPGNASAHANLAVALASKGQIPEARTHFREAVRLDPANASTHFNLGNVLASQRQFQEAVAEYREALRLAPALAPAHCHLGAVLTELGRREEAVAHLQEALRLSPDYPQAREQLQALGVR
jgi:protein O-mannosyl-transferase